MSRQNKNSSTTFVTNCKSHMKRDESQTRTELWTHVCHIMLVPRCSSITCWCKKHEQGQVMSACLLHVYISLAAKKSTSVRNFSRIGSGLLAFGKKPKVM